MKFVIFKFKNLNFLIEKLIKLLKKCALIVINITYSCFEFETYKYLTFNITTTKYNTHIKTLQQRLKCLLKNTSSNIFYLIFVYYKRLIIGL